MSGNMPGIGFGTWKFSDTDETTEIIKQALDCGYRLIDTASAYQNERAIGNALASYDREELFLSGKLWNSDRNDVLSACEKTLQKLQCGYLDLYLMHWPASNALHDDWAKINHHVWQQMEQLVDSGKAKSIGVSNFTVGQLSALLQNCRIKPFVNQIEYHPGFMQKETVDFCLQNGIAVQAWSPLRSGKALKKKEILVISEKYQKTPAQIILKWCIQNGIVPVVKSSNPDRMKSNLDLDFVIAPEDMDYLNALPYLGSSGLNSETLTLFG